MCRKLWRLYGTDIPCAVSDGACAGSDSSRAESNIRCAVTDGAYAGSDIPCAASDGACTGSDSSRAESNILCAGSDGTCTEVIFHEPEVMALIKEVIYPMCRK